MKCSFVIQSRALTVFASQLLPSFYRKRLVELFDKIERGELEEGPKLSSLVTEMHKHRYYFPIFAVSLFSVENFFKPNSQVTME